MKRIKSFLERSEVWFIENDLHIYFGVLTIVVVSCLGWMLYTETEKNKILRAQNLVLISTITSKDREISSVNAELYLSKINSVVLPALPPVVTPVTETVDKVTNKLNDKIERVQNSLITNVVPQEKVITKTQIQTVEKPIPVDSEPQ